MTVRSHTLRIAAIATVLAPFAISVAAHAVPDRLSSAPEAARPPLRFGEYLVNFGRIPEGADAPPAVFRFKNAGDAPLTIGRLVANCGCLTPTLKQKTYAPGETGMFAVKADTAGEASVEGDTLKQHFVDVPYTVGGEHHTARVHLKFVLPERHLVVEPRSLLVYQFGSSPTRREIVVTDPRTPPITVTAVECPDSALTIESQIAESHDDAQRAIIAVTIPGSLDHDVKTKLVIHTDDAEQPVLQIPVVVQVQSTLPQVGGVPLDLVPQSTKRQ